MEVGDLDRPAAADQTVLGAGGDDTIVVTDDLLGASLTVNGGSAATQDSIEVTTDASVVDADLSGVLGVERLVLSADASDNAQSVVLGAFDGGELWTALALRRDGDGFSRVVGPRALRPGMGVVGGDFRRDYRWLLHAAEAELGPVALGLFAEPVNGGVVALYPV